MQSCDNPDQIGLDDQHFVNGTFVDTVTVWTRTEATGKSRTDNRLFVLTNPFTGAREYFIKNRVAGFFKDPVFGTTDARIYTQVLTARNHDFGEDPVLDSAVLVLGYTQAYGDTLSTVEIMVEELEESMGDSLIELYSDKQYTTGQLLGSRSFRINDLSDSVEVQDFQGAGADTVRREYPQLRIRLDNAYMSEKILHADTAILNDYNRFRTEHFKGIAIRMNGQGSAGGGLIAFNMGNFYRSQDGVQDDRSKLILYYRTNNNEDTLRRTFGINSFAVQSNYFGHEYEGTKAGEAINDDTYNGQESIYIQPLAGTQTRIRFPYLKDLGKEGREIKVNKAELILSVVPGTGTPYRPATQIMLHQGMEENDDDSVNSNGLIEHIIDNINPILQGSLSNGAYDRDRQVYRFNITRYVQEVIREESTGDTLYLSVLDNLFFQQIPRIRSIPGVSTPARVVIGGGDHPEYRARLEITYSE